MIVAGAIVPHAPLLLPSLRSAETARAAEQVVTAIASLDLGGAEVTVVASAHGRRSGVYGGVAGSLERFGVPNVSVDGPSDGEVVDALTEAWQGTRLDEPADHGIVVPLAAGLPGGSDVVGAALHDLTGPDGATLSAVLHDADRLADAVASLAASRRVAFVASAHTSAALSARAPLTERPEARRLERRLLDEVRTDLGAMARLAPALWADGGACGVGPLAAFGRLFEGRGAEIVAYAAPVGVGYLVARVGAA